MSIAVTRFGNGGETSNMGFALLRGERVPRRPTLFLRKLALSAAQSWLFNDYLGQRLIDRRCTHGFASLRHVCAC